MSLTPKNWKSFQHYNDRKPAWIKLHRTLLDDYEFSRLPVASRALAPLLWLLASEYDDGVIPCSDAELAFRFRMSEKELQNALKPLIDGGFFTSDSATLADCLHDAIPEEERETQVKTEKDICANFEIFWKVKPKRRGSNPRAPSLVAYRNAVRVGALAEEINSAAKRWAADEANVPKREFVPMASTWLHQKRWEDYRAGPTLVASGHPAKPGSPEFMAWQAHAKTAGLGPLGRELAQRELEGRAFDFESQWPPGYQAAA